MAVVLSIDPHAGYRVVYAVDATVAAG